MEEKMSKKDELIEQVMEEMNEDQMDDCKRNVKGLVESILAKKVMIKKLEIEVKQLKIRLEASELPEAITL